MGETPYLPLIWCDFCDRPQRHTRSGIADVPLRLFDRETGMGTSIDETVKVITVELWRCLACGGERAWGVAGRDPHWSSIDEKGQVYVLKKKEPE